MKKIFVTATYVEDLNIEGPIAPIIVDLDGFRREAIREGWTNLRIENTSCGGDPSYDILGERLETDAEYNKRMVTSKQEKNNKKINQMKKKIDKILRNDPEKLQEFLDNIK